ncbi:MAG: hypothetical protein HFF15_00705 [Angelakisella sp.]|nr:hypothetical protein [Angelakisella sp.]
MIAIEAVPMPKCADWRANFLTADAKKAQEYGMYFKGFGQRQAENLPSRCVGRLLVQLVNIQRRKSHETDLACGRRRPFE